MTEPAAGVSQAYPTSFISLSGHTNSSKSSVDSRAYVVPSNRNKKVSKRKLFSQRKSLMEFTPNSESGRNAQSSKYQSSAVAEVHHSTPNRKSYDGSSSRVMRYAAVARVYKKSQHNKTNTNHGTRKSGGAVHNTEHTCQENVACKSDRLFGKLGVSKESSVLQKEGNLPEFRAALEESALDNASNECNLYVVSGNGKDSEINMDLCHSNSAQEIPEEVGRNDVRNGTEHNNVKLKHIVPNNENTTGKSPESASDEREYQQNNANLICIQPLRDTGDRGEMQGIENMHDTVNIDGSRKNGSDISLPDMYKIYKQNEGPLSYQEYVKEILIACAHVLGCTEIIRMGSNGKEQESDNGHTAERAGEQTAVMRLAPANNRTATNTYLDTLRTQQHPTFSESEGPKYPVGRIICSTSQNGRGTCTGCSDRELPGSSSLKPG